MIFCARKSPYEYMHSVRIEPLKLILVGTKITYQATGDAVNGADFCHYQSKHARVYQALFENTLY